MALAKADTRACSISHAHARAAARVASHLEVTSSDSLAPGKAVGSDIGQVSMCTVDDVVGRRGQKLQTVKQDVSFTANGADLCTERYACQRHITSRMAEAYAGLGLSGLLVSDLASGRHDAEVCCCWQVWLGSLHYNNRGPRQAAFPVNCLCRCHNDGSPRALGNLMENSRHT